MPVRIQRRRIKGWRMPANTVCVSRPSRWGNRYKPGVSKMRPQGLGYQKEGRYFITPKTTQEAVAAFREDLARMAKRDPDGFEKTYLAPLRGKNLACWCGENDPCHGDPWLEIANK